MKGVKKDSKGNILYYLNGPKGRKYYLQLKKEEYPRSLGQVRDGVWYVRRDPEKHTHNKSDSYGFNWELLSSLPADTEVIVTQIRNLKLKTTIGHIKEKGFFLYFMSEGFEKQIFLKINEFDEIPKKSKRVKDEKDEMF